MLHHTLPYPVPPYDEEPCSITLYPIMLCGVWITLVLCYVLCLMIADSVLLHYHLHYALCFQCPVLPASTLHDM